MKNFICLLLTLIIFNSIYSQIQKDKVPHFQAGYVTGAVAYTVSKTKVGKIVFPIVSSFAVGALKELYDYNFGGVCDFKDFLWTGAGGITVSLTFNI